MASSTSQPQSAAPSQPTPTSQLPTNPFVHNVALGVTPIALFALFLPPRRLDLRAIILGGVALWGTNQLVADYSGTSSLGRMTQHLQNISGAELPEKAKEMQARLRAERARRAQEGLTKEQKKMLEEHRRKGEGEEEKGLLERVWMGDSGEDWKAKRDQREKEALSEGGGGYWGLIADQVSEVWNQGKKKENDSGEDEHKEKEKEKEKESESKKP